MGMVNEKGLIKNLVMMNLSIFRYNVGVDEDKWKKVLKMFHIYVESIVFGSFEIVSGALDSG